MVPGVVREDDIDLVHICCLNESQILSPSRFGGAGWLLLTCLSGRVGFSADLENWYFLRFLKEITLIAATPVSLQRADAIGSPQSSAPDDSNLPAALLAPHSPEGPAADDLPDQNSWLFGDQIVSVLVHLLAVDG